MAAGIQEKTTFVQSGKGLKGNELYGGVVRTAALMHVMLVLLGIAILYQHAPPAVPAGKPAMVGGGAGGGGGGASSGPAGGSPRGGSPRGDPLSAMPLLRNLASSQSASDDDAYGRHAA